jgi:tetraacyldisaccharide 4'-kinase
MRLALALQRAWLRRGAVARALWPISMLFGALAGVRRAAFRAGLLRSEAMPVPVIVVGNVVAGGAGKTPIVIELVRHLQSRGIQAGVISRGHGRLSRDCREVRLDSDASEVGDEPLLVARATGAPVFVAPQRVVAGRALLAAHPGCRAIVSDDGLQHHALRRDVEICVFDDRGIGNGWLLPAGPLRERWPRRADLVLRTPHAPQGIAGFEVRRGLAPRARRRDGSETPLSELAARPLTALAAIARPQAFFDMLREHGIHPARCVALPDHDAFAALPAELRGAELICTEKDAVKLWRLRPDAWAVPLVVDVDRDFWPAFDRLLDAKLSSPDGRQTS